MGIFGTAMMTSIVCKASTIPSRWVKVRLAYGWARDLGDDLGIVASGKDYGRVVVLGCGVVKVRRSGWD
jgi:hypothetical protein